MPALTKSNINPDGYRSQMYLSFPGESIVFSRDVNMASITYPLLAITYDGSGTGAYTDVLPDMEVRITRSGVEVGRLRARGTGHTASTLQVGEFSAGQLNLADNDRIEVLRSWRIRPRLPKADETFAPDWEAYVAQHSDPEPICNSGGHYAGWKSSATAVAFTGSTSSTVDPDSGGSLTHAWTFPSGTPSSSSSADPTVDYSGAAAGTYWVTHTVTDSSNSKTATQYVAVRLHDTSDPPYEVESLTLDGQQSGWRASITVPDSVPLTTIADGSLCILWGVEYYGTTQASYGDAATGRSHQKFVGYLIRDSITRDPNRQTLTFEAVSAAGILEALPGFSTVLENASSPSGWLEAKSITVNRGITYRLRELTTVLRTHDLQLPASTSAYSALDIQSATPLEQINELAAAVDALFTTSRNGRLRIVKPLWLDSSTNRNSAATVLTLTGDDVIRLQAEREHRYTYALLEGRSFSAGDSGNQPLFSRAPGNAPSEAPQTTVVERLIAASQSDLNTRTGYHYARQNGLYNALPARRFDVSLRGGYDVFDPANVDEWVKLDSITTRRGDSYSNMRCTLESINISFDADSGIKNVEMQLQEETTGVAGVTYVPPISDTGYIDFSDYDWLINPGELLPIPVNDGIARAPTQAWMVSKNATVRVGFAVTMNAATYVPDWQEVTTPGITGDGMWGCSDPYLYSRKYVLSSDGLWKTENILTTGCTFTLVANNATIFGNSARVGHYMEMSINRKGYIAIASGDNVFAYSTDYGATWTNVSINGAALTYGATSAPSGSEVRFGLSSRNNATSGYIYAGIMGGNRVYYSTNWGATWAGAAASGIGGWFGSSSGFMSVNVPYNKADGSANTNGAAQELYVAICNNTNDDYLYRSIDGGATFGTFLRTNYGGATPRFGGKGIRKTNLNDLYIYGVSHDGSDAKVFKGTPGSGGMTLQSGTNPGYQSNVWNINGWPYGPEYFLCFSAGTSAEKFANGSLMLSYDGGTNLVYATPSFIQNGTDNYRVSYAEFDLAAVQ